MPHGYTNRTMRDGVVVTKTYQGPEAARRCAREAAVLRALAGRLPVPEVIDSGGGRLRLTLMDGAPGQDLIDTGLAGPVLRACGQMLAQCRVLLDLSERWQPGGENTRRWRQRLAITQAWAE